MEQQLKQACACLLPERRQALARLPIDTQARCEELRLRVEQPMQIVVGESEQRVGESVFHSAEIKDTLERAAEYSLHTCADSLRQAAADGERVRRADDAAARIALVHHDPVAVTDLVGRADGGIAVGARGELLVLHIGIGLEQPVVERLGVRRQLRQQRVAAAQIEAGGDLVEKMQLEILILHGLLGRGEHAGRDERRDDVKLHVGQRADAAVGGDIDAFEFRGRAVPVLLRQADKRLDRGGKALHAEPQPADPPLRPDGHDGGGHSGRLHCGASGRHADKAGYGTAMNDFIYNQHDIPRERYRYGLRASADVGCGWVATWNALQILGYKTDIPALIRYYEWQLPLIHGNTGTSFWGPAVCFRKWGFPVKIVVDTRRFDEAAKNADACILFYHWRSKCRLGAHFAALHHTEKGFIGYNTYRNSTGADNYGSSLAEFLRKRKYFGAVLLAINRK